MGSLLGPPVLSAMPQQCKHFTPVTAAGSSLHFSRTHRTSLVPSKTPAPTGSHQLCGQLRQCPPDFSHHSGNTTIILGCALWVQKLRITGVNDQEKTSVPLDCGLSVEPWSLGSKTSSKTGDGGEPKKVIGSTTHFFQKWTVTPGVTENISCGGVDNKEYNTGVPKTPRPSTKTGLWASKRSSSVLTAAPYHSHHRLSSTPSDQR